MPNAEITAVCDSKTKENLVNKRTGYEKLITNMIISDAPETMSQIEISRWNKTSMRRLVQGDFLFIDCDTIITDDLSPITEHSNNIGACLDKHLLIENHNKSNLLKKTDKYLGFNSYISNHHYNSGVIYCTDTPETHRIFNRWHELWLYSKSKGIKRDQPAFNMALYENQSYFTELEGTWNCQIAYNGLPYLANSKIIHYFASDMSFNKNPFQFASESIFEQIRNTGIIPDEILQMLKKPRTAFDPESQIITGKDILYVTNSDLFQFTYLLRKKIPFLFEFFNKVCTIMKNIVKFLIIRTGKKKKSGVKFYN